MTGRDHGRGPVPWWGRLEVRVVASLALLGTLCVGASAYLVQKTVKYFDVRLARVLVDADAVAASIEPIHRDLVGAHISAFKARANTFALQLGNSRTALADPGILTQLMARESDIMAFEIRTNDVIVLHRERSLPTGGTFDEYDVAVDMPVAGTDEPDQLHVAFRIDSGIDTRYQELGRRKHDLGVVLESQADLDRAVQTVVASASILVLLIAVSLGFVLARTTTQKVSVITSVIKRVGRGDIAVRAGALGSDELGRLAEAFDRMLDELALAQERVAYLQRIGVWQDMARRIAHEIKNPLTPIQLAVQQLRDKDPGSDPAYSRLVATSAEIVGDEIAGLRRMVASFSQFAKVPDVRLEPVGLARILAEFERAYGHLTDDQNDQLVVRLVVPDVQVRADRQLIKQVLVNLVENAVLSAREAAVKPVRVVVSASRHDTAVAIVVDDNGPGISVERRQRVFEPYETSRADGTGLGLAIVKKIVLDHGGEIGVEQGALGGARFEIRLPIHLEGVT